MAFTTADADAFRAQVIDDLLRYVLTEDPQLLFTTLFCKRRQLQNGRLLSDVERKSRKDEADLAIWQMIIAQHTQPHRHSRPATPTTDHRDRLSALPNDIRVEILSFLFHPQVECADAFEPNTVNRGGLVFILAFNQLALVSRMWREDVEEFCGHQLLVWKQAVTSRRPHQWPLWRELRMYTSCARMELIVRVATFCAFCGSDQTRVSECWPRLKCCLACEQKEVKTSRYCRSGIPDMYAHDLTDCSNRSQSMRLSKSGDAARVKRNERERIKQLRQQATVGKTMQDPISID